MKQKTPAELRAEIASISKWRAAREVEAREHEARAISLRDAASDEDRSAAQLRLRAHNMGQREGWARLYLAQKT